MLLEFAVRCGNNEELCWLNPALVGMVECDGADTVVHFAYGHVVRFKGEAAGVVRRINAALAAVAVVSPVPTALVYRPLPWVSEIVCKHCGRKYGQSSTTPIACGATPKCPHCGEFQGSAWDVGPVSGLSG